MALEDPECHPDPPGGTPDRYWKTRSVTRTLRVGLRVDLQTVLENPDPRPDHPGTRTLRLAPGPSGLHQNRDTQTSTRSVRPPLGLPTSTPAQQPSNPRFTHFEPSDRIGCSDPITGTSDTTGNARNRSRRWTNQKRHSTQQRHKAMLGNKSC
jgi:hypothetical protein